MAKSKRLSKQQMIHGCWLNRLRDGYELPEDQRWMEDTLIELIEEGLIAYNPQADTLTWVGPIDKQGRPVDPGNLYAYGRIRPAAASCVSYVSTAGGDSNPIVLSTRRRLRLP
jgi:hypothetical protein